MRRALIIAAALALVACGRPQPDPRTEPGLGDLASPRLSGRLYACDVTYLAAHGPVTSRARAMVRMGVDTTGAAPGWKVESVTVVEPLANADGFDPWLAFLPGLQQRFVAQSGTVVTLAVNEGAPMTFDTLSGALSWRSQRVLGETALTGACI